MRLLAILAFIAGLGVITLMVGHYGFADVGHALLDLGWPGFGAIVLLHLGVSVLCGIGWWVLLPGADGPSAWVLIWARLVRDGGSEVLPLSQVGGYVLGGRAATVAGLAGVMAAASTIVDVTMELLSQLTYTAVGLGLLLALQPNAPLGLLVAGYLAGAAGIAVAFIVAQQRGISLLERPARRLLRQWAAGAAVGAAAIQAALRAIYHGRRGLLASFLLHLAGWIGAAVEPWLALRLMGFPLGFGPVLVVESLLYAIRSVAFVVPNALGVQEGAYILLGGMFGIGPETALALSILKRARDATLGLPALLSWQAVESGRAWRGVGSPPRRSSRPRASIHPPSP
jgi:glycosyltransferase 2 family protein